MDPCSRGNSQVLHNNSFNKGAWGSPASFFSHPFWLPSFAHLSISFFLLVSFPNFSISVFFLVSPPHFLCHHSHYHQQWSQGGRQGKGKNKWERCGARVSNIGRVHSSLPQITAINQPGQKLSHQLDLKHWVPLEKPADLHIYWQEGGSESGREAWAGKQKGTSAAKLSLNIISPSLMHYLFNKLLRAKPAAQRPEVTHYAFYNKVACGFWQGTGHYAIDKWRTK